MIFIFALLLFVYYKKRERDGNPIDFFGGNTDSGSSASGISDGPSSIPEADLDPNADNNGGGGGSGGGSGGGGGGSGGGSNGDDQGPNVDIPTVGNETNNQQNIADTTPTDCEGTWGDWTECTAPCGQYGKRYRVYNITVPAKNGGTCIEKQEKNCYGTPGEGACPAAPPPPPPQNCVLSGWYKMDPPGCTEPCGSNGTVEWRRHVEVSQAYGGTCKGGLSKREACNRHTCPVHCVGAWHYTRTYEKGACRNKEECKEYEYRITKNKEGDGSPCSASHGAKKSECKRKYTKCNH